MGRNLPARTSESARVELCVSGDFAVLRDGVRLAAEEIGSRKARTLLKLLAVARPELLSADRIADVLWDGEPPDGADRNIATLVSRLRATLGASVIDGTKTGYRLGRADEVHVDLDVAAALCERAEHRLADSPAVALAAADRASDLLSAGIAFADEPYASWAEPARHEQRELLRRARLAGAQAALATGAPARAASYAEAAMKADNLDELAHRWYMSAAAAAGQQGKALLAYETLRGRLSEELGADPAAETRELHLAILREEDQSPGKSARGHAASAAQAGPGFATGPRFAAGPVLAGRDREVGQLRACWHRAVGRNPELVLIVGEAGIGKTTLAEFIAAEAAADGATILRTRCYETERSLFLQPVVEALSPAVARMSAGELRDLLGPYVPAAAALLPAAAELLGPEPTAHGSATIERRRAFEALATLLRGLADRNPVLMIIDDLQYAGQSTLEALHYIGRRLAGARLLPLVTVRAESATEVAALESVATRIDVGPLDEAAVQQLAAEAGQGAFATDILQQTSGHTLFVVEVLRALRNGDSGVPESLRGAVQARVRQAGAPVESLLRAAAVVGAQVDPMLVGALLDLTPATAAELCERALLARLLAVSGRHYEFANDLIREVLYATTPEPTRLVYHRRAADLLTEHPEALAAHAAASGDWPRAARAWLLAAEEAMRRYAASDAVDLATAALDAADRSDAAEVAVRAQITRGRAMEIVGDDAAALADFQAGADRARAAGDRRQEMHALRDLGGDVPVAVGLPISFCESHLAAGLQIALSLGDHAAEADLLARLAIITANRLQLDTALDLGQRAVAAGRAAAEEEALARGLDGLKNAYYFLGDLRGLETVLAELEPLLRRRGDLFRLQWTQFESAALPFAMADWAEAESRIRVALETNRRGGYPHATSWFTTHLGALARLRGDIPTALQLGRSALELDEAHSWGMPLASAALGTTLLRAGSRAEAIEVLQSGLAAAERGGAEAFVLRCLAPLAEETGSASMLEQAAALLDLAASHAGAWVPEFDTYLCVARGWLAQGDPDRADHTLKPLLAIAERTPWLPVLAEALVVHGRVLAAQRDSGEARVQLRRALQLATEHDMPVALAAAESALAVLS